MHGDGNCCPRAFAQYLDGVQGGHEIIRNELIECIAKNHELFHDKFEDMHKFREFLGRMQKNGEHFENTMIVAAADCYNINVIVYELASSGGAIYQSYNHQKTINPSLLYVSPEVDFGDMEQIELLR